MRIAAGFVLNRELSGLCSVPLYMDHFDGLCLKGDKKGNRRPRNQIERKNKTRNTKRLKKRTKRLIRLAASLTLVALLVKMAGAVKVLKVEEPRLRVYIHN